MVRATLIFLIFSGGCVWKPQAHEVRKCRSELQELREKCEPEDNWFEEYRDS